MTNEKFLEILFDIKKAYAFSDILEAETETASQLTNDDLEAFIKTIGGVDSLPFVVERAIRSVKDDIACSAMSAASKGRLAICRNILRDSKKSAPNAAFWYANTVDGVRYVSDRYRAVAFTNPLPLEEKPDNVPAFDFSKIFDRRLASNDPLELPDRKELAAYIKVKNAEQRSVKKQLRTAVRYNFGDGLPMVNAEYLADMMDIFPDGKFYANGNLSNIYIKSSDGEGAICAIRKPDDDTEKTVLT